MTAIEKQLQEYFANPTDDNKKRVIAMILPDPVSGWVMVQTAAGVIGAAAGVISAFNSYKQLKDIINKLNAVIRLQQQILSEIAALKVYFDQGLFQAFLRDVTIDLQAQGVRYEVFVSGLDDNAVHTEEERQRLNMLLSDIEQTAFKLLAYGPASYQSLEISMILLKSLYRLASISPASQKTAFQAYAKQTQLWLDDPQIGVKALWFKTDAEYTALAQEFGKSRGPFFEKVLHVKIGGRIVGDLNTELVSQKSTTSVYVDEVNWENGTHEHYKGLLPRAQQLKSQAIEKWQTKARIEDMMRLIGYANYYANQWSK